MPSGEMASPDNTGDADGTKVKAVLCNGLINGQRVVGWHTSGWKDGVLRTYLGEGSILEGTPSGVRQTLRPLEASEEVPEHPSNPPTTVYNAIREKLCTATKPLGEAEWFSVISWRDAGLVAEFTCHECGVTRSVEGADAGVLQQRLAEERGSCAWVDKRCHTGQGDDAIYHLVSQKSVPRRTIRESEPKGKEGGTYASTREEYERKMPKNLPLPEFKGEKTVYPLESWFKQLEDVFDQKGIEEEKIKLSWAGMLLKDDAQDWWRKEIQHKGLKAVQSWDEFKERLRKEFSPTSELGKLQMRWKLCRQRGTVAEYKKEVTALEATMPAGKKGGYLLVYGGFNADIRGYLDARLHEAGVRRVSLEKLFEWAEAAELAIAGTVRRRAEVTAQKAKTANVGTAIPPKITGAAAELFVPFCCVCDTKGHRTLDCPKKKTTGGCARCGEHGHIAFRCPQRPKTGTAKVQAAAAAVMEALTEEIEGQAEAALGGAEEQEEESAPTTEETIQEEVEVHGSAAKLDSDDDRVRWFFHLTAPGGKILALYDPGAEATCIDTE